MMKVTLLLCIFSSWLNTLCGSIDCSRPLEVSELIEIALENNPETRQAWWNAQKAAARVGVAKSEYYPRSDVALSVQNGREFKFINGPDTNYTILGADLTLSYLLFDFGTRGANVQAAKNALKAANWQSNWTMQRIILNTLKKAYTTLFMQDALEATLVSLEESEKVFESSQELYQAGLAPITDVYTSESAWINMKTEYVKQRYQLLTEKGNLAITLGLPIDSELVLAPISLDQFSFSLPSINQLINIAHTQRSDLIAKYAKLQESHFIQKKICSSYKPKLNLSGYGGANQAIHDRANAAQYRLLLNLDIPLFNGFETTYQNRMARADNQLAKAELSALELEIAQEVLSFTYALQSSIEMLQLAKENLECAQKAYEGVLQKYQSGKENIFDLSNSQKHLSNVRIQLIQIKAQCMIALVNLAYSTGTLENCKN